MDGAANEVITVGLYDLYDLPLFILTINSKGNKQATQMKLRWIICYRNELRSPSTAILLHTGPHPPIYLLSGSRKIPIDLLSPSQFAE